MKATQLNAKTRRRKDAEIDLHSRSSRDDEAHSSNKQSLLISAATVLREAGSVFIPARLCVA